VFLRLLVRRYPSRDLHVILDNSSTDSTPAVQAWLAAHPRVTFNFTPTGASWLNLVEVWFSILTRKAVRLGSFDTVKALVTHIDHYIDTWNDHPRTFVWTKRRPT
jgi:transposase